MARKKKDEALIQDSRDYVLWRRVSTKKQGKSELGLDAQLTYALEFTKKQPREIFTDVVSGQKLRDCTGLWKAIAYCKENGTYLLIAKTDRFRNVEEACEVLREVGEGNLRFCDVPNCNEMVLKMLWVVWEYQAKMGQINTRLAMKELKRKISEEGGFQSRSGNFCTRLGRKPGCDISEAAQKGRERLMQKAAEWKRRSPGYIFVSREILKGTPRAKIIAEFNEMHEQYPELYCTPKGGPLTKSRLSLWAAEILRHNI